MKTLPETMRRAFAAGVTHFCHGWLIERQDGTRLGLSDHDAPLEIDGVTYHADSGVSLSALDVANALERAHPEVEGILGSPHLRADDLRHGLYDAARFSLFLIDWQAPENHLALVSGTFGPVQMSDGQFRVTLRLEGEGLQQLRGRLYQRQCDAALGDTRCGFKLQDAPFVWQTEIIGHQRQQLILPPHPKPAGWFVYGDVQRGTAPAMLVRDDKIGHAAYGDSVRVLTLWHEVSPPLPVGTKLTLRAGCDKALATCRDKFSNLLNYQGFPDLHDDSVLIQVGAANRA